MTHEWWRDAVIYQVYVRSFADGDGDGVGDLPGVRSRLPYLATLGVDAVWLTPFYASPMADGGYDVADYRAVDPLFGSLSDAEGLIADAHALGLRVIVDIVPNHTSDRHEWFQAGLRDRYHFRTGEAIPNDWQSIFGGPAWSRTADGDWYLHLFAPEQPDLNWDNADVRAEFLDILRFWLDLGVDGFRVDVAHGMVKAAGLPDVGRLDQNAMLGTDPLPYFDQDGVHEIYRSWRQVLDSYPDDRMAVAEAWTPSTERTARYLRPDELHQAFNFHFLKADWAAAPLRTVIDDTLAAGAPATWVLSNHDVVRHVTRYGGGEVGRRRARAAAMLMLALPGSAYVYQGEELGLPEVLDLPDEVLADPVWERSGRTDRGRDGCRVPLPWTSTGPSLGFGPSRPWLPQPEAWAKLAVSEQETSPESMLSLYRAALRARRRLAFGEFAWEGAEPDVLAFRRGAFHCVVNLGASVVRMADPGPVLLASSYYGLEQGEVLLPPDTVLWWEA
jgi:alpha-glucosidase